VQMKTRVAGVVAATASAVALMGAPAFAAGPIVTSGDGSVLSGNQIIVPITIPINACGNAIAVLGFANAGCQGGAGVLVPGLLGW
jgi:hypothetical protein